MTLRACINRWFKNTWCRNLIVIALSVGCSRAALAQIPCEYSVELIVGPYCPLTGQILGTVPSGLNEQGHVCGWFSDCATGEERAFLWRGPGQFVQLTQPPGSISARAYNLNDTDVVVGTVRFGSGQVDRPYLWQPDGQPVALAIPAWANTGIASAINNSNQICGWVNNTSTGPLHAFLWDNGAMIDVGALLGAASSGASDINSVGAITGWMGDSLFVAHAFVWHQNVLTDIGPTLGGANAIGNSLNDHMEVVGRGTAPHPSGIGTTSYGFVWSKGELRNLGLLDGTQSCRAFHIGNDGTIAGVCEVNPPGFPDSAFLISDGMMLDLQTRLPSDTFVDLNRALSVTAGGQVLCDAAWPGLGGSALLTPIIPSGSDLDTNCRVDIDDLLALISQWGERNAPADINQDGIVNVPDLLILIKEWTVMP